MREILLISDLHLSPERPQTVRLFADFCRTRAPGADALYILGDLFDAWIGDDNDMPPLPEIRATLKGISDAGTDIFVQHGNRDFLIGERFCAQTGAVVLPEEAVVDLFGTPTLLMHGDTLCTDDHAYQEARRMLRAVPVIRDFLAKPLAERAAIAAEYRRRSGEAVSLLAADIMDVNADAVVAAMSRHGIRRLIHGHTHREARHEFDHAGLEMERIVLGEWHPDRGPYLAVSRDGLESGTWRPRTEPSRDA